MTQDTILIRIKKLMAMTEARGATPEEAATAAAKAQALLFEHNLTMAQVDATSTEKHEEIDKHIYEMMEGKDGSMHWRKLLLHVVTKYNFCKMVGQIDGLDRRTAIVGKKSNVDVCIYIYEHTQREIHKMAKAYQKLQTQNKSMFYTSFCAGAVTTIGERLKAQQATSTASHAKGNELMVVAGQQLAKVFHQHFPNISQGKKISVKRADGFELGKQEGRNISLNRGVGTSPAGAIRQIGGRS